MPAAHRGGQPQLCENTYRERPVEGSGGRLGLQLSVTVDAREPGGEWSACFAQDQLTEVSQKAAAELAEARAACDALSSENKALQVLLITHQMVGPSVI